MARGPWFVDSIFLNEVLFFLGETREVKRRFLNLRNMKSSANTPLVECLMGINNC